MVRLSKTGQIVESVWLQTPAVRPDIKLEAYVVMPNHFPAIFFICDSCDLAWATHRVAPTKNQSSTPEKPRHHAGPKPRSVGAIIAQFKSIVTKRINHTHENQSETVWQRNYYEHDMQDEESFKPHP
jgi:putative transposase